MTKQNPTSIALMSAQNLPFAQDDAAAPDWVHLLPAASGAIQTGDKRGPYHVTDAAEIIALSFADTDRLPIDENHATDLAAPKGYPQFIDTLRFQLTTRAEFERLVATRAETLTDLERAARFLYLQRTAFGGKVSGRNFGVSADRPARFILSTLEPMLEDVHSRLSGVVIECLGYSEFIRRYDTLGTLFYLDPPYWGSEDDYGKAMFAPEDFDRLAEQLAGIKGRFLMSINDVEPIRERFAGFALQGVETTYSVGKQTNSRGSRRELFISNFDFRDW